jgi:hypothetical protein
MKSKDIKALDKSEPADRSVTIDSHQEVFKTTDNVLIAGFAGVASGVVASIITVSFSFIIWFSIDYFGKMSSHTSSVLSM